jgi:hypothetical protein
MNSGHGKRYSHDLVKVPTQHMLVETEENNKRGQLVSRLG